MTLQHCNRTDWVNALCWTLNTVRLFVERMANKHKSSLGLVRRQKRHPDYSKLFRDDWKRRPMYLRALDTLYLTFTNFDTCVGVVVILRCWLCVRRMYRRMSQPDPSADWTESGTAHSNERSRSQSVDYEQRKVSFRAVRCPRQEQNDAQSGLQLLL